MNLLSLLGVNRWLSSLSDQVHEAMAEGAGGLEARTQLAKQEWVEERLRLQQLVVCSLLCIGLLVGVLLGVSMAVVVTFWDTGFRTLVAWLVVAFWLICLMGGALYLRSVMRRGKEAFKYTKQELGKDWKTMKDQF